MENEVIDKEYYIDKKDLRPIGKGTFGEVYKCHKKNSNDVFCVKKIIVKNMKGNNSYLKDEIKILETIKEEKVPNAIQLYKHLWKDEGKPSEVVYLIMDLCEGGSLDELIKKHEILMETDIYYLLEPVMVCLAELHRLKIIHRDLKAENILLLKKWNEDEPKNAKVRLIDFGVSAQDKNMNLISTVGTPMTMAPEIIMNKKYNESVDVYSFGIILHQMLFGSPPFNVDTYDKWFKSKISLLNLPKSRFLTVECFDLIQRCLMIEPKKRITFEQMKKHPFFERKGRGHPFYEVFDGTKDVTFINMRQDPLNCLEALEEKNKVKANNPFYKSNRALLKKVMDSELD